MCSIRLSVRTSGFHPGKSGSTPLSSTKFQESRWAGVLLNDLGQRGVLSCFGDAAVMVWQETVNLPTSVTTGSIPVISTKNVPASLDTLTQRTRSEVTLTGGSL